MVIMTNYEIIKHHRLKAGISLGQLAKATELDKGGLSKIENGKSNPTVKTLAKVCKVLNLKVEIVENTAE